jgi:transcriptional regulator with XRE-family HTH domain
VDARETFGANLKRERKRLKLSQERVGELSGLNMTEVSRLERAERDPRLGTIVKLAKGLGVAPMQLLDGIP